MFKICPNAEEYVQKGGFVKRTVIVFAVLCSAVLWTRAWVPEDFYLNNTPLQSPAGAEIKILPSTLRVVLFAGEAEEIYADVVPENVPGAELSWSLSGDNGVVQIYPRGKTCAILAVSEGEENLSVSCGGKTVNIPVAVRKAPKVQVRSFDHERKSRVETGATWKAYRTVVRVLITLGAILCFGAVLYIMNNKAGKRK